MSHDSRLLAVKIALVMLGAVAVLHVGVGPGARHATA